MPRMLWPTATAARYNDLGPRYFDERDRQAVQRRLVRRLQQLGLRVTVEPITPAA